MTMLSVNAIAVKHTITNSGNTFTPNNITINLGDTVVFAITSSHNAVEVSESTWNSNGNTPLPGGFSVPFGGGSIKITSAGLHYYVCQPHASMGMKGIINVIDNTGIFETNEGKQINLSTFPNPVKDILNISLTLDAPTAGKIDILDRSGKTVYSADFSFSAGDQSLKIDISAFSPGFYFMVFKRGDRLYAEKIIKM